MVNGVDIRQNTWIWTYFPWFRIFVFLLMGIAGISVGIAAPVESIGFHIVFTFVGIITFFSAFMLSKARLFIESDKKILMRTTGPWMGFSNKTTSISLDSVCCVIFRWKYIMTKGKLADRSTHRLLLRDIDGKECDIFPENCLCANPKRCGQSMADFLQVEFQMDGKINRPFSTKVSAKIEDSGN